MTRDPVPPTKNKNNLILLYFSNGNMKVEMQQRAYRFLINIQQNIFHILFTISYYYSGIGVCLQLELHHLTAKDAMI